MCPIRPAVEEKDPTAEMNLLNGSSAPATLEVDGDPATISAFAVYDKQRRKKAAKRPVEAEPANNNKVAARNPLAQFLEAGRTLGVYGLAKTVDFFRLLYNTVKIVNLVRLYPSFWISFPAFDLSYYHHM